MVVRTYYIVFCHIQTIADDPNLSKVAYGLDFESTTD